MPLEHPNRDASTTGGPPRAGAAPLEHTAIDQKRALLRSMRKIVALSRDFGARVRLYGRIKSIASASKKMQQQGLVAHQVLDTVGIRVVIEDAHDCYRLIRRIHSSFPVLAGEYDDYIAVPKPNGYRSLHTTVVSPGGLPVEIQIRTCAMHADAERGAASHARYKNLQASVASDG